MTQSEFVDDALKDYRTTCCNVPAYRKSRANNRCTKCEADVTLEMVFLIEALLEEYLLTQKNKSMPDISEIPVGNEQVYEQPLPSKVCGQCYSDKVASLIWVNPNTDEILSMDPHISTEWCEKCNATTELYDAFINTTDAKTDWSETEDNNTEDPSCEDCGCINISYAFTIDKNGKETVLVCDECNHLFESSLR